MQNSNERISLYNFLIQEKALEKYIQNCINHILNRAYGTGPFILQDFDAFTWSKTPEGNKFWSYLEKKYFRTL